VEALSCAAPRALSQVLDGTSASDDKAEAEAEEAVATMSEEAAAAVQAASLASVDGGAAGPSTSAPAAAGAKPPASTVAALDNMLGIAAADAAAAKPAVKAVSVAETTAGAVSASYGGDGRNALSSMDASVAAATGLPPSPAESQKVGQAGRARAHWAPGAHGAGQLRGRPASCVCVGGGGAAWGGSRPAG